ncbi:DinB family protein [Aquimarina sp. D1M17]|uniref:DinB family protein n=1 Tax=Aquimarina acroporae TaxID=2937283 RepID=UPI0020BF1041|nr:DinB family protein [Aquimarina acroporae]MCK8522991.1 DinB family protein [Aquimarina acroporae]
MKFTETLVSRLKEVLTEGEWVTGTNFKDQIIDLNWRTATQKVDDLNSIADLIFHVNYYIDGVAKVLEGGELEIRDKYSFDYPAITSAKDWEQMVSKFCSDSEKFIDLVADMPEEQLQETFVDEKYGNYCRNIEVIIEHTYYHLGQVLLLKKLIKTSNSDS